MRWLYSLLTNSVILGIGILTGALAARALGPAGRGEFAVILYWPQLLSSLLTLGTNEALALEIANLNSRPSRYLTVIAALTLGLTILIYLACWAILPRVLAHSGANIVGLAWTYAYWFVPLYLITNLVTHSLQGAQEFGATNLVRLVTPVMYAGILIWLYVSNLLTVGAAVHASIASLVLGACLGFSTVLRPRRQESLAVAPRLIKRGFSLHVPTILLLLSSQMDKILVVSFFGMADIGMYVVIYAYATTVVGLVSLSFWAVSFTEIAAAAPEHRRGLSVNAIGVAGSMVLGIGCLLAAVSPWLLPLIFGKAFGGKPLVASLIIAAHTLMAMRLVLSRVMKSNRKDRFALAAELLAALIFVPVGIIAIYLKSLLALSIGLFFANGFALAVMAHFIRVATGISLSECIRAAPSGLQSWCVAIAKGK